MKCPCGRDKEYNDCCGLVHQHMSNASTAEDLMRSRYSAFTMANGDYLLKSHHSATRPQDSNELVNWAKSVKWIKLEVLNSTGGGVDDHEGTVEFKAHFKYKGRKDMIHENSRFVREFGSWVYLGIVS